MTAAPLPGAELVRRFDRKLGRIIGQDLPVLKRVKKFLIKSGGKRIRPITHYYFTQLLGYTDRDWEDVGAIGELIHGASLLHDDVVDEASIRRGRPSVNALEGNKTAILAGDYMLGCGLDHLNTLRDSSRLLDIFTRVLRMLSVGELLQMQWEGDLATDDDTYRRIILCKTGVLFGAMTQAAWVLANPDNGNQDASRSYREFGERLGTLFQLRDDFYDYFGTAESDGKEPFQDFRRGLVTRPLILLRVSASRTESRRLQTLWKDSAERSSLQGVGALQQMMDRNRIRHRFATEIEEEVHELMTFVRGHKDSPARERLLQQLRKLLVPVNP